MPRRRAPEDLSVEELRRLLIAKRRGPRRERLEHFRRTGRVVAPESTRETAGAVIETSDELVDGAARRGRGRRFMDGVLLAVEVLAVLGLIAVLFSGLGMLRDLNREVAAALRPATPVPT